MNDDMTSLDITTVRSRREALHLLGTAALALGALASADMNAFDAIFSATVVGHPPHRSLMTGEPYWQDLGGSGRALLTPGTSSLMPPSPSTT